MRITIEALTLAACLSALAVPAEAQGVTKNADGSFTYQAGVDGVMIDVGPGEHWKIRSKYEQPVTFADKRGIKTATIIAEEKAKGHIISYIKQDVFSKKLVGEFDGTLESTTKQKNGSSESLTEADQRKVSTTLTEITGSSSEGMLSGVIVLEQGYDPKEQEVWVVAGVSDKSIARAKMLGDMMSSAPADVPPTSAGRGTSNELTPPRQVKRNDSDF